MKRIIFILLGGLVAVVLYLVWLWVQLLRTRPDKASVILALVSLSLLVTLACTYGERKRALRQMRGRPLLTDREFGHRYFPSAQAEIAAQVKAIFARHISVDVAQVHPDDELIKDLRMDALDSMSTVEFLMELEEYFKVQIPDSTAERMQTIRAITECIAELQSKRI